MGNHELWHLVVQFWVDVNMIEQIMNSGAYSLLNDELNEKIMNSGAKWFESRGCFLTWGGSIPGGRFFDTFWTNNELWGLFSVE